MKKLQLKRLKEIFKQLSEAEKPLLSYEEDKDLITFFNYPIKGVMISVTLSDLISKENTQDKATNDCFYDALDHYIKSHTGDWVSLSGKRSVWTIYATNQKYMVRGVYYSSLNHVFFFYKDVDAEKKKKVDSELIPIGDLHVLNKLQFLINYK